MIDSIYDPGHTSISLCRYLVAVAESGSFGQAAKLCDVSQPTLSAQIAKWERSLDTQIFERDRQGARLTELGQELLPLCRRILDDSQSIERLARQTDPLTGPVRIGIIPTLAPYLLPALLTGLQQDMPAVTPVIQEAMTEPLLQQLAGHHIDIACLAIPVAMDDCAGVCLGEEAFLLAVPTEHELAQAQEIDAAQLAELPLLLLDDGHCLRDQALDVCRRNNAHPALRADMRASSLATLQQLVAGGFGCTLLPAMAAAEAPPSIHCLPINTSDASRQLACLWRSSDGRGPVWHKLCTAWRDQLPAAFIKRRSDPLP